MQALTAVRRFLLDERGVTAIEYGLIAAVVALAAVTAMGTAGDQLDLLFTAIKQKLADATPA